MINLVRAKKKTTTNKLNVRIYEAFAPCEMALFMQLRSSKQSCNANANAVPPKKKKITSFSVDCGQRSRSAMCRSQELKESCASAFQTYRYHIITLSAS